MKKEPVTFLEGFVPYCEIRGCLCSMKESNSCDHMIWNGNDPRHKRDVLLAQLDRASAF